MATLMSISSSIGKEVISFFQNYTALDRKNDYKDYVMCFKMALV
jgi:hypothetical protein